MDFLYRLFDSQLEIELDADGNAAIAEAIFSAAEILQSDRTAYNDAYNAWLNEEYIPGQLMKLEAILSLHGNRERFSDLCRSIENCQVVPLVGSGMSVPSGLPTWSEFLRKIRPYSMTVSAADLDQLLANGKFEEAADCLASTITPRLFSERIDHGLRVQSVDKITGAVRFLPDIFKSVVLTTNLDNVLEKLYELNGQAFAHVLYGADIGKYRTVKGTKGSCLLKLHGDHHEVQGRVLRTAEYDAAYASGGIVCQELTLLYQTNSLLCLGASLYSDRTVSLIASVAARDDNMPKHYAFLSLPPDDGVRLAREAFLAERDIFPIWYNGSHDEDICALLVGILRFLKRL